MTDTKKQNGEKLDYKQMADETLESHLAELLQEEFQNESKMANEQIVEGLKKKLKEALGFEGDIYLEVNNYGEGNSYMRQGVTKVTNPFTSKEVIVGF